MNDSEPRDASDSGAGGRLTPAMQSLLRLGFCLGLLEGLHRACPVSHIKHDHLALDQNSWPLPSYVWKHSAPDLRS